jgi:hypothetical protein
LMKISRSINIELINFCNKDIELSARREYRNLNTKFPYNSYVNNSIRLTHK